MGNRVNRHNTKQTEREHKHLLSALRRCRELESADRLVTRTTNQLLVSYRHRASRVRQEGRRLLERTMTIQTAGAPAKHSVITLGHRRLEALARLQIEFQS